MTSLAIGLVASLAVATACTSKGTIVRLDSSERGTTSISGNTVPWAPCKAGEIAVERSVLRAALAAGLQCGRIEVPVDPAEPDGTRLSLAVTRLRATGTPRKGSVVFNPGGPGGSGLEFLASSYLAIPSSLREHFDIVSFDPRGVAASTPLNCLTQAQRRRLVDEPTPDDPTAARNEALTAEKEIASGCDKDNRELYRHMATRYVVEDLDALRAALGDHKLSYVGLSYGTRIGAGYLTAHPDKVRAVVLDGSVTPSPDLVESEAGQAKGLVRSLLATVAQCNADPTCPAAPDSMTVMTSVANALDTDPFRFDSKQNGTESLTRDKFLTGVITALYDPATYLPLMDAVHALSDPTSTNRGQAAAFLADLAGRQSSRQPDGTYGNGLEAQSVVNCQDADRPLGEDRLARARERTGPIPPLLDRGVGFDTPSCTALPTGTPVRIAPNAAKAATLVVGTRGDPATPYEWTEQMVAALGGPALLTYEGSGHTASLTRRCVTDQVVEFLDSGTVPTLHDCPRDPTESDLYAQIGSQLTSIGLSAQAAACVGDQIRSSLSPLQVVTLNGDEPEPQAVAILQRAVLLCR
ncbi:MAG: alpha/beta hydrolase [Microthrixaceae bacterium]